MSTIIVLLLASTLWTEAEPDDRPPWAVDPIGDLDLSHGGPAIAGVMTFGAGIVLSRPSMTKPVTL